MLWVYIIITIAAILKVSLIVALKPLKIFAGDIDSCAFFDDRSVRCWGGNYETTSPLFENSTIMRNVDIHVLTMNCVIFTNSTMKCWGNNAYGSFGNGKDENTPNYEYVNFSPSTLPPIDFGAGVIPIDACSSIGHTCAILNDSSLKCWGFNYLGQLGYGDNAIYGRNNPRNLPALNLGENVHPVSVHCGELHTCVQLNDTNVKCWGNNDRGQLGYGDYVQRNNASAVEVVDFGVRVHPIFISLGTLHNCAILNDTSTKCWGSNEYGPLGYGKFGPSYPDWERNPAILPAIDFGLGLYAKYVDSKFYSTCFILNDDSLKCVGLNKYNALGITNFEYLEEEPNALEESPSALDPINLGNGRHSISVSVGREHTCVILDNHSMKCWGENSYGKLGYGDTVKMGRFHPSELSALFEETASVPTVNQPTKPKSDQLLIVSIVIPLSILMICCVVWMARHRKRNITESKSIHGDSSQAYQTTSYVIQITPTESLIIKLQYLCFISYFQDESALSARFVHDNLESTIQTRKLPKKWPKQVFLDSDNLTDLRNVIIGVKEAGVLILILSPNILTRPWCLVEIYTALINDIPILTIFEKTKPFNFKNAVEYLKDLPNSLEASNPGASAALKSVGVDLEEFGKKFSQILPNIVAIEFDPKSHKLLLEANFKLLLDRIETALKASSRFIKATQC